ncbi:hypothetical protein OV450_7282 [Actinobacteria bacterium OV450]|nr:hypothetical protein OV450_7282 [Actinobacteria bacterium OV450]
MQPDIQALRSAGPEDSLTAIRAATEGHWAAASIKSSTKGAERSL